MKAYVDFTDFAKSKNLKNRLQCKYYIFKRQPEKQKPRKLKNLHKNNFLSLFMKFQMINSS